MTLHQSCLTFLNQVQDLIHKLEPAQYCAPHAHCFGASVGGHVRHCLEHIELFFHGLKDGRVNYDERERNTVLECNPEITAARITELKDLACLCRERTGDETTRILVRMDCGDDTEEWKTSSIGRELQFLISHTIHHFAIIGIMCHGMGVELPPEFGIAPSTIRHEKEVGKRKSA